MNVLEIEVALSPEALRITKLNDLWFINKEGVDGVYPEDVKILKI
jgi:hypothetical protein